MFLVDSVVWTEDTQPVMESSQPAFLNLADQLFTIDTCPLSQPSAFHDISSIFFQMGICLKPSMLQLLVSDAVFMVQMLPPGGTVVLWMFSIKW